MKKRRRNNSWLWFILGIMSTLIVVVIFITIFGNKYAGIFEEEKIIETQFLGEYTDEQLINGALAGMAASLDDQWTVYMTPEEMDDFDQSLASDYVGIGVGIVDAGEYVMVSDVFANSPAEAAGVQVGDLITMVDGVSTADKTSEEVIDMIKGDEGTMVDVTFMRGDETYSASMERSTVDTPTVTYEMIDEENHVGYIEIDSIGEKTADEFGNALLDLESQGMQSLVIDLRNDGGGYLTSAEAIANMIVPNTEPYLYTKDNKGNITPYTSSLEEPKTYPIVVIENEYTASAAEILVGALKGVNGAQVVGETSYGKGVVQTVYPILATGGSLKITTEEWLTVGQVPINGVGITPTIEVPYEEGYIAIDNSQTYSYDQVNENISYAQSMLNTIGYYTDRSDGYYDESTVSAVEDFQSDNNLPVTGEIDPQTASMINTIYYQVLNEKTNDPQLQKAVEVAVDEEGQ